MKTILVYFALLSCCVGLSAASNGIDYAAQSKLKAGAVTKDLLTKLFGKPTKISDLRKLTGSKETGENWIYEEQGLDRLVVFFDEGSSTATTWTWAPVPADPEHNLKSAVGRFPNAAFVPETEHWINPHNFPSECYLKDYKLGLSIQYKRTHKEVLAITHWDVSRTVASAAANEKPPQFCIDNSCAAAIPAEKFFREISVAQYCDFAK